MAKKKVEADRKERVEQMRREQQAKERRRTGLIIGASVLVVVVLAGIVAFAIRDYTRANPSELDAIGVPAADASCDPVTDDPADGVSQHVGPGTSSDVTRVDYDSVPPSHGEHFASPAYPASAFYTAEDRPPMENLVHNLEHGYTIIWYDESLPTEDLDMLERISDIARGEDATGAGKFIVSAWDSSYGELPADKPVALSHWGVDNGHRQLCGAVSGEVVQQFITDYPASDSPEPNGA